MTTAIEHTTSIVCPKGLWNDALNAALRVLRRDLQAAGGFSKAVRTGDRIVLDLKGPPQAVLDAVKHAAKIQDLANWRIEEHRKTIEKLANSGAFGGPGLGDLFGLGRKR